MKEGIQRRRQQQQLSNDMRYHFYKIWRRFRLSQGVPFWLYSLILFSCMPWRTWWLEDGLNNSTHGTRVHVPPDHFGTWPFEGSVWFLCRLIPPIVLAQVFPPFYTYIQSISLPDIQIKGPTPFPRQHFRYPMYLFFGTSLCGSVVCARAYLWHCKVCTEK